MAPVTRTFTAPPPACPSTSASPAAACASRSCSCIFCACLSRSLMSGMSGGCDLPELCGLPDFGDIG